MTYEKFLIEVVVPTVLTVLAGLIMTLLEQFRKWVKTKIHSDSLRTALTQLDDVVETVVRELEQAVRPTLSDGKLTPEERSAIKKMAVSKAQELILPKVKQVFDRSGVELEKYLSSKVESVLHKMKSG